LRVEPSAPLSSFQQVSLVVLRTLIGWHFLYEGMYKLRLPAWSPDGHPMPAWSAAGFIQAATGPVGKMARAAVGAGLLPWIDRLMMVGVAAVGLSLILGLLTRAGCVGGLLLLGMFYLMQIPTAGVPQPMTEGSYLLVNKTLVEGAAVLALLAFDTGRIAGLDRLWHERRRSAVSLAADGRVVQQGSGT
jgi:thiosulfate dehydrogenase [quinone] large subunit